MRRLHPSFTDLRAAAAAALLALVLAVALAATVPAAGQAGGGEGDPPAEEAAGAAAGGAGKVVVGRIDGEIDLVESAFVKRLIDTARIEGASAVVLDLNTFGGRVDAAVAIRDSLLDAKVTTAVYINRRAISAGALISLACEKIAVSPGATIGAAAPVVSGPGQEVPEPVAEKYLSYFRQEMRSTAETRGRDGDIAEAMADEDVEIPGVSEAGKLLTLNSKTAVELGIADSEADGLEAALAALGLPGEIHRVERTWSEGLVGFLTSPAVASLLFLGLVVGGYLEYQTPGFGFFGAAAITCFLLLYFSHYLVNLAGWEEVILFSLGALLLLAELVIAPGFGLLGVAGLTAVLGASVMLLMAGDWSDVSFSNPFTAEAALRVLLTAVAAVIAIGLLLSYLPRSRRVAAGGLMLDATLDRQGGYLSHDEDDRSLTGATGEALTPLRPAGRARIAGQRMMVETEGDFVERGDPVKVLRVEEGRIVVRRA